MSRYVIAGTYQASGSINPASIVKQDLSNVRQVLQAGVGDILFGICQIGSDALPTSSVTPIAAATGEPVQVYAPGSTVPVTAGVGGYTVGDLLTADLNGNAVTAKPGDYAIAMALETAAASEIREVVTLQPHTVGAVNSSTTVVTTTSITLTAANANGTIFMNGADLTATLPTAATSKGFHCRFINGLATATYTGGSVGTLITMSTADATAGVQMKGHDITTPANGKGLVNTAATAKGGDTAEVFCDGVNYWELPVNGTWTRQT